MIDCFICDRCNAKLQEALEFQQNCIKIYRKNNPNYQQFEKQVATEEKHDEYLILQTCEEFTSDGATTADDQYTVFEINTEEKEVQIEETPTKKSQRQSSKPKNENSQKCLILDDQSEVEETLVLNDDEIIVTENQDISYKFENLDDSSNIKKPRKSYTAQQKLEIIEYSEKLSNREAARKFNLNESTIRSFKRQKESLLSMNPQKSTNRRGVPYWPELEKHLKEWVEKQPTRPKMNDVREEAIKLAKKMGYDNFSGSNTYIFKFMQRNNIEAASPRPRKKLKIEANTDSG